MAHAKNLLVPTNDFTALPPPHPRNGSQEHCCACVASTLPQEARCVWQSPEPTVSHAVLSTLSASPRCVHTHPRSPRCLSPRWRRALSWQVPSRACSGPPCPETIGTTAEGGWGEGEEGTCPQTIGTTAEGGRGEGQRGACLETMGATAGGGRGEGRRGGMPRDDGRNGRGGAGRRAARGHAQRRWAQRQRQRREKGGEGACRKTRHNAPPRKGDTNLDPKS
eukprot:350664-Chlamydomonas_euryale.AAC.3